MEHEGRLTLLAAAIMWAVAITLMCAATAIYGGPLIVAGWAILVALWACVWTGWALLLRERHRVATICKIVESADRGEYLRSV